MTEDNMRMASFRIDKELWAKFSAIAKSERYTVTEALTAYIQLCTDNDKLEVSVHTSNEAIDNSEIMTSNYDVDIIMQMVNTAIYKSLPVHLEEISERVNKLETELEAYTRAVTNTDLIALPTTTKTTPSRIKPEGEPDWVNKENKRFYSQLAGNSELIAKVTEAIALHPTDNKALAESLVSVGLHKADGTALDSSSMSRIKKVVSNLNTPNR